MPSRTSLSSYAQVSSPFAQTSEQRVELARQRFFDEGERTSGVIPELVIQSWTRCLSEGRRPNEALEFDPVYRGRKSALLARNYALLQEANEELNRLDQMLAGTAAKAFLTDPKGRVLRATRMERHEGAILHAGCRVGVDLSELSVGTAALGIAASTGNAASVKGALHFFQQVRSLNCVAAPIRDSRGGIAGVVGLSIQDGEFGFDAAHLVAMTATLIENRLLARQARELVLVRIQASPTYFDSPLVGLVAIDLEGCVASINPAAARQLGCKVDEARGREVETILGSGLPEWLLRGGETQPRTFRAPSGLMLWADSALPARQTFAATGLPVQLQESPRTAQTESLTEAAAAVTAGEISGCNVPVPGGAPEARLADVSRHHIIQALAANGGNISRTASALGVSRGFLYRRMKPISGKPRAW